MNDQTLKVLGGKLEALKRQHPEKIAAITLSIDEKGSFVASTSVGAQIGVVAWSLTADRAMQLLAAANWNPRQPPPDQWDVCRECGERAPSGFSLCASCGSSEI